MNKRWLLVAMLSLPALCVGGDSLLSWTAPTTRTDGALLPATEIGGYRVYHGSVDNDLTLLAELANTPTTYTHVNAVVGTHYYAVTTFDTVGNESGYSNIVAKVFLSAPAAVTLTIQ